MSKQTKHENPYTEGSNYAKLFTFFRQKSSKNGGVSAKAIIAFAVDSLGMAESAAKASVQTVLLTPQPEGHGKDCRGNASAQGHIYYAERLKKTKGNPLRYCLRWRTKVLEPKKVSSKKVKDVPQKTKKVAVEDKVEA